MKRMAKGLIFALALSGLLFSCGTTKEAAKANEERVDETLPVWDDGKEDEKKAQSEKADETLPAESEENTPIKTTIDKGSSGTFMADGGEKAKEMEGVKKEAPEVHSGDYPNMDRSGADSGERSGVDSAASDKKVAKDTEIKNTSDAKALNGTKGTTAKTGDTKATGGINAANGKKVAVAKRAEDIVVVDDLPNIVQENESVLFSSDWDEESLSDPEDCGYFYTTDNLGEFTMIKGEFRKLGGYEGSTVGFVFGFSPTKDGWLKDYIRFEINTRGEYGIYSWVNGKYTDLVQKNKPDTAYLYESAAINTGYNRKNTLTIVKEKDGTYTLSINDTVVAKKVPPLKKGTKGVMAFFSVGKEDQENFPENPVTVVYRIPDSKR